MTTSDYIYKLVRVGEILGLKFVLHDQSLPKNVAGRICYRKKTVRINEPCAEDALMIVAHELGHFFHHLRNKDRKIGRDKREISAYLYGWGLLKRIKAPISKEQWIGIHS